MKTNLPPFKYLTNVSLAASFLGPAFEARDYYGFGMEIIVSAATGLSGVFSVESSNDGTHWFTNNQFGPITLTTMNSPKNYGFSGFGGTVTEIYMIAWVYVRYNWTRSAGTGTGSFVLAANRWG